MVGRVGGVEVTGEREGLQYRSFLVLSFAALQWDQWDWDGDGDGKVGR